MFVKRMAIFAILVVALGSCSRDQSGPKADPPEPPPPVICPLTGEIVDDDFDVEQPVVALKVDNIRTARPHAGLESADIVYEEIVEGGITRFMAVYHCREADEVGPIRSARAVDADILREYVPVLFGYSGGNPGVRAKVGSTEGVVDLAERSNGSLYRKMSGRSAPSNLSTSTGNLRGASNVTGAPSIGLVFNPDIAFPTPDPTASPGAPPPVGRKVTFSYSRTNPIVYTYDDASNSYLRFHGDTPHKSTSGVQLSARNVVVLKIEVTPGRGLDSAGNPSPEINLIGSGKAFVLRGGHFVEGEWKRPSLSARTTITTAEGPIELLPGNTWIHLLPSERTATVE